MHIAQYVLCIAGTDKSSCRDKLFNLKQNKINTLAK